MSYCCELCKEPQGIGERPTTIVVESRDRNYGGTPEKPQVGWEIVKEVRVCQPCLEVFESQQA